MDRPWYDRISRVHKTPSGLLLCLVHNWEFQTIYNHTEPHPPFWKFLSGLSEHSSLRPRDTQWESHCNKSGALRFIFTWELLPKGDLTALRWHSLLHDSFPGFLYSMIWPRLSFANLSSYSLLGALFTPSPDHSEWWHKRKLGRAAQRKGDSRQSCRACIWILIQPLASV